MNGPSQAVIAAAVTALSSWLPGSAERSTQDLSQAETAHILAHGPWPPVVTRDPSNRASGNAAAIGFGRRMFHETRMSANGYVACVGCHQTNRAWTDAIARARALAPGDRNTPTLANVVLNTRFGWGGSSDSVWMASLRPILDEREMGGNAARVAHVVRIGDGLACEYRRAFGRTPESIDDETVMVDVGKAIAAFLGTLLTGRTPFDDFRDALERGDRLSQSRYPAAAVRGARVFEGRGGCAACHAGPNFTDGSLRASGSTAGDDGGSTGSAGATMARYSRAGPFNDDPQRTQATAIALSVTSGRFRVPSLRNVAVTPPYMHDGSVATLREASRHAGTMSLTDGEVDDVVAFLGTLTDAAGAQRPIQRPGESTCR